MTSQLLVSPRYREASRVALALQVPIALVCLLLLDGGGMARVCTAAMLAFWIGAGLVALRRRWTPTSADLFFWRWGFVGCFALAVLFAAAAGFIGAPGAKNAEFGDDRALFVWKGTL